MDFEIGLKIKSSRSNLLSLTSQGRVLYELLFLTRWLDFEFGLNFNESRFIFSILISHGLISFATTSFFIFGLDQASNVNLRICRHLLTNSDFLFSMFLSSKLFKIWVFSVTHSQQKLFFIFYSFEPRDHVICRFPLRDG